MLPLVVSSSLLFYVGVAFCYFIDQSGVSRHLRILDEAGFVTMRPDGARRLYSLRPAPVQALDEWVRSYRELWEGRLDRFDAALARRRGALQREGGK